jgi:hypothetical protein
MNERHQRYAAQLRWTRQRVVKNAVARVDSGASPMPSSREQTSSFPVRGRRAYSSSTALASESNRVKPTQTQANLLLEFCGRSPRQGRAICDLDRPPSRAFEQCPSQRSLVLLAPSRARLINQPRSGNVKSNADLARIACQRCNETGVK